VALLDALGPGRYLPRMRKARTLLIAATLTAAALGVGACGFSSLTTSETDVAVTIEDEQRDYSKYKTYSLTDEIVDLCEVAGDDGTLPLGGAGSIDVGDCFEVSHALDKNMLAAIDKNMQAFGYEKVGKDDSPDVTVLVSVVARDNWYYAPGYWWCDPYYYYSCWYPTTGYYYNFPTGTALINMVDNSETEGKVLSSAWFAGLSGLYSRADDKTGAQRIEDVVDRAFAQSPYLEVGK
jgi:Domain of unknown function (DUF4136)